MEDHGYIRGEWKLRPQATRIVLVAHGREVDVSGFGATIATVDGWWNGKYDAASGNKLRPRQVRTARLLVLAPRMHDALLKLRHIYFIAPDKDWLADALKKFWMGDGMELLDMLDADTTPSELLEMDRDYLK